MDETTGSGTARCEAECIPDTRACADAGAELVCGDDERYGEPSVCDTSDPLAPERCFDGIGCSACDPGTFSNAPSVRCNPEDPRQIQACRTEGRGIGTWGEPLDCPESYVCTGGTCQLDLSGTGGATGAGGNAGLGGLGGIVPELG